MSAWLDRIDLSAHGWFAITDQRCGFDWNVTPGRNSDGTADQTVRGHPFNYFTQVRGHRPLSTEAALFLSGFAVCVRTALLCCGGDASGGAREAVCPALLTQVAIPFSVMLPVAHPTPLRLFPSASAYTPNPIPQGVAAAEVEIDVLTGDHSILRADVLVDLGSSINPALDVGQIEGAFVQ